MHSDTDDITLVTLDAGSVHSTDLISLLDVLHEEGKSFGTQVAMPTRRRQVVKCITVVGIGRLVDVVTGVHFQAIRVDTAATV